MFGGGAEAYEVEAGRPSEMIMRAAGRWFKRWDWERGVFVSNMREQYPDD